LKFALYCLGEGEEVRLAHGYEDLMIARHARTLLFSTAAAQHP
jgi:hypothetical protein